MPRHFSAVPQVLAADLADPVAWRRGRERYAVWLIDADLAPIDARLAELHRAFGDLWLPQQRQPHVTLHVCGFAVDVAQHDDDIDASTLESQRVAIEKLAMPAFDLSVGGLDSFDSAAFLTIDDPAGALDLLRDALSGVSREIRIAPYLPHLTVALYRDAWPKHEVAARYAACAELPPLRLPVHSVRLATYAAAQIAGPLTTLHDIALRARNVA